MHDRLDMNRCLWEKDIPELGTKEKTTPLQKDPIKNRSKQLYTYNVASDEVENINGTNSGGNLLISHGLFHEEQKWCHTGSRRTGKLLYIDKQVLTESKMRRKDVVWHGPFKKWLYDIFSHNWIIDCLKMYQISDEVIKFIEKTRENWRIQLTAGGKFMLR